MIYVVDASAVVDLLVRSESGERVRRMLAADHDGALLTVAHLDADVFSALTRLARAGVLGVEEVNKLLERLGSLTMKRLPITGELLRVAWALRDNVGARDAIYVAAAHGLDARLLTTDDRLARAVPDLVVRFDEGAAE